MDHQSLNDFVGMEVKHLHLFRGLEFLAEFGLETCNFPGHSSQAASFLSRYASKASKEGDKGEILVAVEVVEIILKPWSRGSNVYVDIYSACQEKRKCTLEEEHSSFSQRFSAVGRQVSLESMRWPHTCCTHL